MTNKTLNEMLVEVGSKLNDIVNQEGFTSTYQKMRAQYTIEQIGHEEGWHTCNSKITGKVFEGPILDLNSLKIEDLTVEQMGIGLFENLKTLSKSMTRSMVSEPSVLLVKEVNGNKEYHITEDWIKWFHVTSEPKDTPYDRENIVRRNLHYVIQTNFNDNTLDLNNQVLAEILYPDIETTIGIRSLPEGDVPIKFTRVTREKIQPIVS